MTKKHEELVEEIAEILYGSTLYALTKRQSLDEAITLILSAVRDGRLDEELGVVGRAKKDPSKPATWTVTVAALESLGATELSALRGTGKEEEKNGDGSGRPD